ncbi:hypothetical protein TNCV_2508221 [Trichonephila clavipes]|nr:hypothetical protein TNCV_2508221 [Trichonephila clavipes]
MARLEEITVRLDLFLWRGLNVDFVTEHLTNGSETAVLCGDGDSTEEGAAEDVAWDGFLEVLGLGCWSGVEFFARCSQKLTLGGAGGFYGLGGFFGSWVFLFNFVSRVSGATQEAGRVLSFAQTALGLLVDGFAAIFCQVISCTLNASGCASAESAGVEEALASEALGWALFWS